MDKMPASMKAKLRGHHLICLNFFRGEGYSEDFIKNIHSVIRKQKVEVVAGPDEVCKRCPYLIENKCADNEYTNEKILFQDKEALRLLGYKQGEIISWKTISAKLPGIIEDWKAQFCADCRYLKVCFG
ncbi:MAG: DUF1284 domain-containing protein [Candidatus Methanoperedens sp.]